MKTREERRKKWRRRQRERDEVVLRVIAAVKLIDKAKREKERKVDGEGRTKSLDKRKMRGLLLKAT